MKFKFILAPVILVLMAWAVFQLKSFSSETTVNNPAKNSVTGSTQHFNISVVMDMSNRITTWSTKPVHDSLIISKILDLINPTILMHKRSMHQMDSYSLSFTNSRIISDYKVNTNKLQIDLGAFKNDQIKRRNYLFGTKGNPTNPFEIAKSEFISEFKKNVRSSQKSHTWGRHLYLL